MSRCASSIHVVLILSALGSTTTSCGAPRLKGDGVLVRVRTPRGRGIRKAHVGAGEKFVVFQATGPNPVTYVTDDKLRGQSSKRRHWDAIGVSTGRRPLMLGTSFGKPYDLVTLPGLRIQDILYPSFDIRDRNGTVSILSDGQDWIRIGGESLVTRLRGDTFDRGRHGRVQMDWIWGAAIDQKTGLLVLCGDHRYIELFDLRTMKSLGRTEIPDVKHVFGVAATEGVAWIGTRHGELLQFDIANKRISRRISLLGRHKRTDVHIDQSISGRFLAVCASRYDSRTVQPTVLKLYRIDKGELKTVAEARVVLDCSVSDLALLEDRRTLILASGDGLLAWRIGEGRSAQ